MKDFTPLPDYTEGDACPVHGTPFRKVYTYGGSMSGETEVCTFSGCRCAVSVKHDPVGTYAPTVLYHETFASAAGRGRLHAMQCTAKYR